MESFQSIIKDATIIYKIPVIEKKASSTNSLYVGSTIMSPNVKSILRTIAAFLYPLISKDPNKVSAMMKHPDYSYFCEEKYIIENPEITQLSRISPMPPTKDSILFFIGALYDSAKFTPECCIVCIIYLTRLLFFEPDIVLHSSNWRPLILVGLIVAQKVL